MESQTPDIIPCRSSGKPSLNGSESNRTSYQITSNNLPATLPPKGDGAEEQDTGFFSSKSPWRPPGATDGIHQNTWDLKATSTDMRQYNTIAGEFDAKELEICKQYETLSAQSDSDTAKDEPQILSWQQRMWDITIKFWFWEIAACVLSLVCLACIVGVLVYENGKPLDQWRWVIPPTAVVSFIGTLGKASCALVLSQVLSQMKWLHFQKTRSLQHIRVFDSGSRGPLGSIWVLWTSKKLLASVAACLMILTILVDPFIQLVFSFPSRLVEDPFQRATFQTANSWDGDVDFAGVFPQKIWTSLMEGLTLADMTLDTDCTTGNCAWPEPITTLGVCGSCLDVTAAVEVNCSTIIKNVNDPFARPGYNLLKILSCSYTLNGTELVQAHKETMYNKIGGKGTLKYQTLWNSTTIDILEPPTTTDILEPPSNPNILLMPNKTTIEFNGQREFPAQNRSLADAHFEKTSNGMYILPIYSAGPGAFTAIQFSESELKLGVWNEKDDYNSSKLPPARCWGCRTNWCEKSFEKVQVASSGPATYTVSSRPLRFVDLAYKTNDTVEYIMYGFYPDELDSLKDDRWKFRYRVNASMMTYLDIFFSSFVGLGRPSESVNRNYAASDLSDNIAAIGGLALAKDLNITINKLADSLTESIRTSTSARSVFGQALVTKSFIQVQWAWLALPMLLVIAACALLVIIAVQSHRNKVAVWKDDPLALLLQNVKGIESLSTHSTRSGPAGLDNLANEMHVRLDRDNHFTFVRSSGRNQRVS